MPTSGEPPGDRESDPGATPVTKMLTRAILGCRDRHRPATSALDHALRLQHPIHCATDGLRRSPARARPQINRREPSFGHHELEVGADGGACRLGVHSYEIGEVVDHKQASSAELLTISRSAPSQRIIKTSGVVDLAHEMIRLDPGPDQPRSPATVDAVRGQLAHDENTVVHPVAIQARTVRVLGRRPRRVRSS
jgi:hypothetical protein